MEHLSQQTHLICAIYKVLCEGKDTDNNRAAINVIEGHLEELAASIYSYEPATTSTDEPTL